MSKAIYRPVSLTLPQTVIIPVDYWEAPFAVSTALEWQGTVSAISAQVAYTLDDLNPDPRNPNLVGWTPVYQSATAVSVVPTTGNAVMYTFSPFGNQAGTNGQLLGPITAIKWTVTTLTGATAAMIAVLQGLSPFGG